MFFVRYNSKFDVVLNELSQAVKASQDCVVQPALRSRGLDHNVQPRLLPIEAKKRKQRSQLQSRQLPGNMTGRAKATYSLGFLRSKRIVAFLGPDVPQSIWRHLSFVLKKHLTDNFFSFLFKTIKIVPISIVFSKFNSKFHRFRQLQNLL